MQMCKYANVQMPEAKRNAWCKRAVFMSNALNNGFKMGLTFFTAQPSYPAISPLMRLLAGFPLILMPCNASILPFAYLSSFCKLSNFCIRYRLTICIFAHLHISTLTSQHINLFAHQHINPYLCPPANLALAGFPAPYLTA